MATKDKKQYLQKIGCCSLCVLRYSGEKSRDAFRSVYVKSAKEESCEEKPTKISKTNPCISCVGLLQDTYLDSVIDKASADVIAADYDCPDFSIAISLPVSFQIRSYSMSLHVVEEFSEKLKEDAQPETLFVSVKDVWKWIAGPKIAKAINKTFVETPNGSSFSIVLNVEYEDDEEESAALEDMHSIKVKSRHPKHRPRNAPMEVRSRKSVEPLLSNCKPDVFKRYVPCPPAVPRNSAVCSGVILSHSSVFVAGRYRKLSRHMSQTPWLINEVRQMETSVQELLCDRIVKLARADDMRFSSSGREDVDVRMLGRGRPFACELINARHTLITDEEFRAFEKEILEEKNGVEARLLQIVSKDDLSILKEGEEEKVKVYRMYCVHPNGELPDYDALQKLCDTFPITLQQRTPVRVLHRRALATRPRTLHWMKVEKPATDDKRAFVLRLATQAGTYVKEFVHGDLGRTEPNLCGLLGVEADILALDVEDILIDWPPELNSTKNTDEVSKDKKEADGPIKPEKAEAS